MATDVDGEQFWINTNEWWAIWGGCDSYVCGEFSRYRDDWTSELNNICCFSFVWLEKGDSGSGEILN